MRKKGNLFQRMLAVLLCGMLVIGMTSQALPAKVFAAETDIIEEKTQIQDAGNAEQATGTEKPESTEADEEQAIEEKSDAGDEGQTETMEEPAVQESTQVQDAVNGDELSIAVLAQNAERSGSYGLWVNGIQVTDGNAADVLGDSTVSYAPDTNVLTLNGAKLTTAYKLNSTFSAVIYADSTFGQLKLNIQGENTITASGDSYYVSGILAMDSMEFSGDGSLTVTAENQYTYGTGYAVNSNGNVTITGGTYSFKGIGGASGYGYGMCAGSNTGNNGIVYVNGGTLTTIGAGGSMKFAIGGTLDYSGYANCEVIASLDASGTPETDYNSPDISYYAYIKVMPWKEPEYDENGFSTDGRFFQPAVQADDGYYELTNAGNLYWFAELMKSGTASGYENVRLTEDITIPAGMNWKPIRVELWETYQGTFDGNGKSISNLSVFRDETDIYDTSASAGLFNTIGVDGIVKNLTMRNASIKVTASAGAICGTNYGTIENCCNSDGEICVSMTYAGGIAGFNDGKIVRCYNTGTVDAQTQDGNDLDCVGGICGYATECAVIENCYNIGAIGNKDVIRAGGVTGGYETGAKITGCYNIGAVTAGYGAEGIGCFGDGSQPPAEDVKNNYYLAETESDDGGRTEEQFASGEVAWLLNEGKTDGTQAYYQTCGEGKPAFTGQTVYRVMSYQCPGDTNGKETYNNADENVTGEHSYGTWTVTKEATEDEPGLKERSCGVCGDTQTEVIPKTGGMESPDSGRIEVDKEQGENTPAVEFETAENDIIGSVLTPEEQNLVTVGTDVKILLTIDNIDASVKEEDKQAVEEKKGDYTVGEYLDINLIKIIGENRTAVTHTDKNIRITITLPESLRNNDSQKTRTFAIVRVHEGAAELLPDLDSAEDTITIETDKFSTYALVYHEENKNAGSEGSGTESGDNSGSGDIDDGDSDDGDDSGAESGSAGANSSSGVNGSAGKGSTGKENDKEPKTGDTTPVEICATLAMVAGFSYLLLYFESKKRGMTEREKNEIMEKLIAWGRKGGKLRRYIALAVIFAVLVYYHSIGKQLCMEDWAEICEGSL